MYSLTCTSALSIRVNEPMYIARCVYHMKDVKLSLNKR